MPSTTIHGRFYATGKRKSAIARVFLKPGSGEMKINGRTEENYFPNEVHRMIMAQPFELVEKTEKFDVDVNVHGGGVSAQAQAVRHGITKALLAVEDAHRSPLKKAGLITRDARVKERKKPGQPGARKKFQYSKR